MSNIIIRIKTKFDKFSSNPTGYEFLHTDNERELLRKYMKNSAIYLEFGSGGSTFEALKAGCKKVVSVESSADWVKYMKSWKFIRRNIKKGELDLRYINIGKIKEWGIPIDNTPKYEFLQYSDIQLSTPHLREAKGLVFIDGRFRVACCLNVIRYCKKDTVIVIHDFYSPQGEEHYQNVLLKYLNEIDKADSLGVFNMKLDIDINELLCDYEMYKYNFN